jgi:hypothetical protein
MTMAQLKTIRRFMTVAAPPRQRPRHFNGKQLVSNICPPRTSQSVAFRFSAPLVRREVSSGHAHPLLYCLESAAVSAASGERRTGKWISCEARYRALVETGTSFRPSRNCNQQLPVDERRVIFGRPTRFLRYFRLFPIGCAAFCKCKIVKPCAL